jgi:hypothetical protein
MTELYIFLAVLAAVVVAGYALQLSWTGLRPGKNDQSETKTKTLWDWLALLIVPFVLGSGAYGINSAQANREKDREIAREKQQDAVAEDARHATALSAYLQQMSGLIADKGLAKTAKTDKDGDGFADAPIAGLAQSLTTTVLRQLDGARKGEIAQFLARSGLIPSQDTGVISLYGADLRGAKLFDSFLSNAYFAGADLPASPTPISAAPTSRTLPTKPSQARLVRRPTSTKAACRGRSSWRPICRAQRLKDHKRAASTSPGRTSKAWTTQRPSS